MTENSENPFGISTSSNPDLAGSRRIDLNDSGTCAESGAPLTQACSGFDLSYEDDRRKLIARRVRDGAHTPDGHTYSNILELRENWEKARPGDFAMQHIPRLMLAQERRLVVTREPQ